MKRKATYIIAFILMTIITATALFSCVRLSPQKSIAQTTWGNYEKFEYNVKTKKEDGSIIKGKYTVSIKRINATTTINDQTIKDFSGSEIKETLIMDNGDKKESTILINSNNSPCAAFVKTNYSGEEHTIYVDYEKDPKHAYIVKDKNAPYLLPIGKWDKTLFLVNESMYQILRSLDPSNKNLANVTFACMDTQTNPAAMRSLTAAIASVSSKKNPLTIAKSEELEAGFNDKKATHSIQVKLNQKEPPAGAPIFIWIGENYKVDENHTVLKPVIQIKEHNTLYVLDKISITE